MDINRREFFKVGIGVGAFAFLPSSNLFAQASPLLQRKIPSGGESLPIIGIGTARRYASAPTEAQRGPLLATIKRINELGGRVIDTAPRYGDAESVVGNLVNELKIRDSLFLATKVRAEGRDAGIEQLEKSFKKLHTSRIDLIAVHNLTDTQTQLHTLREFKAADRIRYIGVTVSRDRRYENLERTMKSESLDFIQVDYALDNRSADQRILPLAADRGMAVMINLPFGRGRLFKAVRGKELPPWASEFDCASWAQFFLKYIVSHPAVTCAIPGTAKVKYAVDNLGAARGRLPDPAMRRRMESFIDTL